MGKLWYFDGILRYFSKANMPLCNTVRYFWMVYRGILTIHRVIRRKIILLIYIYMVLIMRIYWYLWSCDVTQ